MSTVLLLFLFYNKLLLCLRLNFDDTIVLVLISTLEHKYDKRMFDFKCKCKYIFKNVYIDCEQVKKHKKFITYVCNSVCMSSLVECL